MKIGDHVTTPHGNAEIIDMLPPETEWTFGKPDRKQLLILRFSNGRRGAWYRNAVKPLEKENA